MPKVIGNTVGVPNPKPDWNQNDETKSDFIKNKPTKLSQFDNDCGFANNEELKSVPKMVNQEKELVCQYVCDSADYTLEGIIDISVNRKLTKDNITVYVNGKVPDGSYISDYGSGDFVIYWNGPRLHYMYAEDKMRIVTGNFGADQDGDVIEVYIENENAIKEEDIPNAIARTQYVDRLIHAKVGDIEAALLEIEAIADALIGGDA